MCDERAAKAALYNLNRVGRGVQEIEEAWIVQALVRLPAGNKVGALDVVRRESLSSQDFRGIIELLWAIAMLEKKAFVLEKPRLALQRPRNSVTRLSSDFIRISQSARLPETCRTFRGIAGLFKCSLTGNVRSSQNGINTRESQCQWAADRRLMGVRFSLQ